jgi:hypothetical protein
MMGPKGRIGVVVKGTKLSLTLEPVFIEALKRAAKKRKMSVSKVADEIHSTMVGGKGRYNNLSQAVRCWLLAIEPLRPVYGSVDKGNGIIEVSEEPIDWVPCPFPHK